MNIQKINWKLFIEEDSSRVAPEDFFKAFNAWIPGSPEVFVDVADYQHVHDGPLVVLVGHYASYALDATNKRLGLLYGVNRERNGTNEERIVKSLSEVLKAGRRLEEDESLRGRLLFNQRELLFTINDRALAPNTPETFNSVSPVLHSVLERAYGPDAFNLEHASDDPRQRFAVIIRFSRPRLLHDFRL